MIIFSIVKNVIYLRLFMLYTDKTNFTSQKYRLDSLPIRKVTEVENWRIILNIYKYTNTKNKIQKFISKQTHILHYYSQIIGI